MKHLILSLAVAVSTLSCGQHNEHDSHNHDNSHGHHDHNPNQAVGDTETFPTVGFVKTHEDTISFAVEDVFPLFEPQGRHLLYENWEPTILRDSSDGSLEGQVIFSKYDEMDVMLTVRKHNPDNGHIQYLVVWEDFEIQRIDIYCTFIDENSTHVKWVEHNAGLYETGTKPVTMFCTEGYLEQVVQRYFDNVKKTLSEKK